MRIVELEAQANWVLSIVADDGRVGRFDVSPYLQYEAFEALRDEAEFKGASGFSVGRLSGYYGWPRRARPCKTPRSISTCSACSRRGP